MPSEHDPESSVVQDTRDTDVIFVHSAVDDAGLSAAEFRVYGHLARRAGANGAYPGIDSMAKLCQLSRSSIIRSVQMLEQRNMISVRRCAGERNRYVLTRRTSWKAPVSQIDGCQSDTGVTERLPSVSETPPPVSNKERKEIPYKVIQEGNPVPPSPLKRGKAGKLVPTNPMALRICQMFHRKPSTPWTPKEVRSFRAIAKHIEDEDLAMCERRYKKQWPPNRDKNCLRHEVFTFLNNYPGEVDRSRTWCEQHPERGSKPLPPPIAKEVAEQPLDPDVNSEGHKRFLVMMAERKAARKQNGSIEHPV